MANRSQARYVIGRLDGFCDYGYDHHHGTLIERDLAYLVKYHFETMVVFMDFVQILSERMKFLHWYSSTTSIGLESSEGLYVTLNVAELGRQRFTNVWLSYDFNSYLHGRAHPERIPGHVAFCLGLCPFNAIAEITL